MLRSLVSCAALTAAALTLGVSTAHAQTRYDGYCYVNSADMATDAAATPCLNGEYYAYTDGYRPAPRAPRGYQVEYFTSRPSRDLYSQVYNASTLTANFDPGARNHFGNGDRYAYNQDDSDVQPGAIDEDHVRGWRDDSGVWHEGQPSAYGWRDGRGHWHQGRVAAYGWQDDRGVWHERDADGSDN